jgi:hypothetical protein
MTKNAKIAAAKTQTRTTEEPQLAELAATEKKRSAKKLCGKLVEGSGERLFSCTRVDGHDGDCNKGKPADGAPAKMTAAKVASKKSAPKLVETKSETREGDPAMLRVLDGAQGWIDYISRKLKTAKGEEAAKLRKQLLNRQRRVAELSDALAQGQTLEQLNASRPRGGDPVKRAAKLQSRIDALLERVATLKKELAQLSTPAK